MRNSCREEIRELALQEMLRMKAQTDTKTTVVVPSNPYPYPGLLSDPSAIRLVVLLPSVEKHADIVCVLCNGALSRSESDQYEALSYVWGDSLKRRPITVSNQQFQATENLELALRHLRQRDRPRVLWIDSLCINQNDVAESNAKVQQLDRIYKSAQKVVVWLGPESDTSGDAFDFLRDQPRPDPANTDDRYHELYWTTFASSLLAFHRLLQRAWFTRVWCIQEFILGQRVVFQCGQHRVSLEDFESMFYLMVDADTSRGFIETFRGQGPRMREEFAEYSPRATRLFNCKRGLFRVVESVLGLLSEFREWASSDPRDLIFAFYGLVSAQNPLRDALQPDYSLNVAKVYIRVAVQCLQEHRDLDLLPITTQPVHGFVDISRVRYLPCWVPDWRDAQRFGVEVHYRSIAFHGLGTHIFTFDTMYNAVLGLKADTLGFQDDNQILCLDGINVDAIDDIGDIYMGHNQTKTSAADVLLQWKDIAGLSTEHCYKYTGEPVREAFWRTVLLDEQLDMRMGVGKLPFRYRIPPKDAKLDWLQYFPPTAQDDLEFMMKATAISGPMIGRRFFKTTRGLFGLAPASAQKGDRVVVLFGGKAPFVIRDFRWYQVIGEW